MWSYYNIIALIITSPVWKAACSFSQASFITVKLVMVVVLFDCSSQMLHIICERNTYTYMPLSFLLLSLAFPSYVSCTLASKSRSWIKMYFKVKINMY